MFSISILILYFRISIKKNKFLILKKNIFGNIPRKCIPRDIPMTTSSEYSEGLSPRNIPTDTLPRNIPTAKVYRNIPTAEVRRNIPIPLFSRNVSEDRSIGNIRGDTDEQS